MTKKQKYTLLRIILSGVMLVLAVFMPVVPDEGWVRLLVFLIPYLVIGYDILWQAVVNIFHGEVFDENFLMSVATVGAFCINEYPEAVAVMLFYQVGELFQSYAVGKSRKSISSLMDIRPDYANMEVQGKVVRVSPEEVSVGDIILIKPGEKIPLDGEIVEGSTSINTSALTGESLPRDCGTGDKVISGSININGVIRVKVSCEFGESTVSKILNLVENSSSKKAKSEKFITRFSRIYTPAVVISAALLAIVPTLLFGDFNQWIHRALIFLVISCPCALVISVPLSFFGGIGGASKCGILVKGSNYLEALAKTKTVVFDKTGTLTEGGFTVTAVHPEKVSEEKLIELAAMAESYSNHPISHSLIKAYGKEIDKSRIEETEEISGHGIITAVDGNKVAAGNGKLMSLVSADWHNCHKTGTVVHIAVNGEYAGHIVISDSIKGDSAETIKKLKQLGIKKTVMLTGDIKAVGESVGQKLGIDEVYTELLPDNKVECVEKLLAEKDDKTMLAFVGDGINDAPVLSRADVGIAMGGLGSDAAIEAADIVLMDDKPSKIPVAINISKRTIRIVKQNIIFALGVKLIVLLLGAFGAANMWEAVFADVGVSVIAILNALRALNIKKI